jgi:hypothetical protein
MMIHNALLDIAYPMFAFVISPLQLAESATQVKILLVSIINPT